MRNLTKQEYKTFKELYELYFNDREVVREKYQTFLAYCNKLEGEELDQVPHESLELLEMLISHACYYGQTDEQIIKAFKVMGYEIEE